MHNYPVNFKLLTMPCDSTGIFFFKFMFAGTDFFFFLGCAIPLISPCGIWDLPSAPVMGCVPLC